MIASAISRRFQRELRSLAYKNGALGPDIQLIQSVSVSFADILRCTRYAMSALTYNDEAFGRTDVYAGIIAAMHAVGADKEGDLWLAIQNDAKGIEDGQRVWEAPLWHGHPPAWAVAGARQLVITIETKTKKFQRIRTWLEDRSNGDHAALRNRPPIPDLEIARALIPDEIWNQGIETVDAEFERLERQYWPHLFEGRAAAANTEVIPDTSATEGKRPKQPKLDSPKATKPKATTPAGRALLKNGPQIAIQVYLIRTVAASRLSEIAGELGRQNDPTGDTFRRLYAEFEQVEALAKAVEEIGDDVLLFSQGIKSDEQTISSIARIYEKFVQAITPDLISGAAKVAIVGGMAILFRHCEMPDTNQCIATIANAALVNKETVTGALKAAKGIFMGQATRK